MNKQLNNSTSKIAAYLRKSRVTQDSDDTLQQHRASLQDYIKYNEFKNVEWFEEVASGESIEYRPVFKELLDMITVGKFDAVLVVHEDRLSRGDQYEQGMIQRAFKSSGTLLLTPSGITDYSNSDQVFQSALKGLFANHELEQIKRRMTEGKKRAVKDGRPHTGQVPFPYYWDKNTKTALVDPQKAKIYRQIIDMYVYQNISTTLIAEKMHEQEVTNPSGFKNWRHSTVQKILKNRFHLGVVYYGHYKRFKVTEKDALGNEVTRNVMRENPEKSAEYIEVQGNHEPLKTEAEHAIIMELFEKRSSHLKRERRKYRETKRLHGLVRCPYCGTLQTPLKSGSGKIHIKKCHRRNPYRMRECAEQTKGVNEEVLYPIIIEHLKRYKNELFASNIDSETNKRQVNALNQSIENYEKAIEKAEGNIARAKNLAIEGLITPEEFREIKEKEQMNAKKSKYEIKQLQQESTIVEEVKAVRLKDRFQTDDVVRLLESDDGFTPKKINEILRMLIDSIMYRFTEKNEIEVKITFN